MASALDTEGMEFDAFGFLKLAPKDGGEGEEGDYRCHNYA
jgi:hypothetical protein